MVGAQLTRYWPGEFLIFDTEGESLNLGFTRPWQVAWGVANLKQGIQWTKKRYIYWKDLDVSRGAAIKTRFNPALYAQEAKPAAEVLAEFRADLNNPRNKVVFQNGLNYDVYAIRNWERGCGVPHNEDYLLRCIDTNPILKAQIKGWQIDVTSPEAFWAWLYKGTAYIEKGLKTNLTDIARARQIDHDFNTTHDALSDIELMWKVFKQLVYEIDC